MELLNPPNTRWQLGGRNKMYAEETQIQVLLEKLLVTQLDKKFLIALHWTLS
jgi:hypothetical protein